ncbi:MAG: replication-associated recombination protein A [Bacteroidota bacterium]
MHNIPLAERMRPEHIDEYIGQEHVIGPHSNLRKALDAGFIPSIILWGPPGVGKTTLARIISSSLDRPFYKISAINSGVKEIREIIEKVKNQGLFGNNNAILFIDEIHRFSKSQQDSLLGAVESGTITLIGATTENPSFEVNSALLSRCQVFVLESLTKDLLKEVVERALKQDDFLKSKNIKIKEYEELIKISGGDARKLLNALEILSTIEEPIIVDNELTAKVIGKNLSLYDKNGEQHYDIISAFIKSIRGSDPNAAVYYLARMIEGGEDPKFIARRLIILASEDIGNANPSALALANSTFEAVQFVGWPESRIILSQCAIYLACSDKSNSAYEAINKAQQVVKDTGDLSVPLKLRNAPTQLMKELGYGKDYKYAHAYDNSFVKENYLPENLSKQKLYEPGDNPKEKRWREKLQHKWNDHYDY